MTYDPTFKRLVDEAVARTEKRLVAAGFAGIRAILSPLTGANEIRVTFQREGSKKEKPVCLFTAMLYGGDIVSAKRTATGWFGLIKLATERKQT